MIYLLTTTLLLILPILISSQGIDYFNETSYDMSNQCIEDNCTILDKFMVNIPFNNSYTIRLTNVWASDILTLNIHNVNDMTGDTGGWLPPDYDDEDGDGFFFEILGGGKKVKNKNNHPYSNNYEKLTTTTTTTPTTTSPNNSHESLQNDQFETQQLTNQAPISIILLDAAGYKDFLTRDTNNITGTRDLLHKDAILGSHFPIKYYPGQVENDLKIKMKDFFITNHDEVNIVFLNENANYVDQMCPYSIGIRFHGFGCLYEIGFLSLIATVVVSLYITSRCARNWLDKNVFHFCWCCWWDDYNTKYQEAAHNHWRMRRQEFWLFALSYHQAEQRLHYEHAHQFSVYDNEPEGGDDIERGGDDNSLVPVQSKKLGSRTGTSLYARKNSHFYRYSTLGNNHAAPTHSFYLRVGKGGNGPQVEQAPVELDPFSESTYNNNNYNYYGNYSEQRYNQDDYLQNQDLSIYDESSIYNQNVNNNNTQTFSPRTIPGPLPPPPALPSSPRPQVGSLSLQAPTHQQKRNSLKNQQQQSSSQPLRGLPPTREDSNFSIKSPVEPFIETHYTTELLPREDINHDMSLFTPKHIRTALDRDLPIDPNPEIHQSLQYIHQHATSTIPVSFIDPVYYNNLTLSTYSPMFLSSFEDFDLSSYHQLQFVLSMLYSDAPLCLEEGYFYPPQLIYDGMDEAIDEYGNQDDGHLHEYSHLGNDDNDTGTGNTKQHDSNTLLQQEGKLFSDGFFPVVSEKEQINKASGVELADIEPKPVKPKTRKTFGPTGGNRQSIQASNYQERNGANFMVSPLVSKQSFFYNFAPRGGNKIEQQQQQQQQQQLSKRDKKLAQFEAKIQADFQQLLQNKHEDDNYFEQTTDINPDEQKRQLLSVVARFNPQTWHLEEGVTLMNKSMKFTGDFMLKGGKFVEKTGKQFINVMNPTTWIGNNNDNNNNNNNNNNTGDVEENISNNVGQQNNTTPQQNDSNNDPTSLAIINRDRLWTLHEESDEDHEDDGHAYNPTTITTTTAQPRQSTVPILRPSTSVDDRGNQIVSNDEEDLYGNQDFTDGQTTKDGVFIHPQLLARAERTDRRRGFYQPETGDKISPHQSRSNSKSPSVNSADGDNYESIGVDGTNSSHGSDKNPSEGRKSLHKRTPSQTQYSRSSSQSSRSSGKSNQYNITRGTGIRGRPAEQPTDFEDENNLFVAIPLNITVDDLRPVLQRPTTASSRSRSKSSQRSQYQYNNPNTNKQTKPSLPQVPPPSVNPTNHQKPTTKVNTNRATQSTQPQQPLVNTDNQPSLQAVTQYDNQVPLPTVNVPEPTINNTGLPNDPLRLQKQQIKQHSTQQQILLDDLTKNYKLYKNQQMLFDKQHISKNSTTSKQASTSPLLQQTSVKNNQSTPSYVNVDTPLTSSPPQPNQNGSISPLNKLGQRQSLTPQHQRRGSQQFPSTNLNKHITPSHPHSLTPSLRPKQNTSIQTTANVDQDLIDLNDGNVSDMDSVSTNQAASLDPFFSSDDPFALSPQQDQYPYITTGQDTNDPNDLYDNNTVVTDNTNQHSQIESYVDPFSMSVGLEPAYDLSKSVKPTRSLKITSLTPEQQSRDDIRYGSPDSREDNLIINNAANSPQNQQLVDTSPLPSPQLDSPSDQLQTLATTTTDHDDMVRRLQNDEDEAVEMKQLLEYGFILGNSTVKDRINNNIKTYISRSITYSTSPTDVYYNNDYQDETFDYYNDNHVTEDKDSKQRHEIVSEIVDQSPPRYMDASTNQNVPKKSRDYLYIGDLTHLLDNVEERLPNLKQTSYYYNDISRNPEDQVNLHYSYTYDTIPSRLDYLFHVTPPQLSGYGKLYEEVPWCLLCCNYKPYQRSRPSRVERSHPFSWWNYDKTKEKLSTRLFNQQFASNHKNATQNKNNKKSDNNQETIDNHQQSQNDQVDTLYANYARDQNRREGFEIYDEALDADIVALDNDISITKEELYQHAIHHHFRHQRGCCFFGSKYKPVKTKSNTEEHEQAAKTETLSSLDELSGPSRVNNQFSDNYNDGPTLVNYGEEEEERQDQYYGTTIKRQFGINTIFNQMRIPLPESNMNGHSKLDSSVSTEELSGEQQFFLFSIPETCYQKLISMCTHRSIYVDSYSGAELFDLPKVQQYDHAKQQNLGVDTGDDFFGKPACYWPTGTSFLASLSTTSTGRYEQLYVSWRDAIVKKINFDSKNPMKHYVSPYLIEGENGSQTGHVINQSQSEIATTTTTTTATSPIFKQSTTNTTAAIKTSPNPQPQPQQAQNTTITADKFHVTLNSKIDVIVHDTVDANTNQPALYITRAINVRQNERGLYIMIPPPHVLDIYHLNVIESDSHKYQWGWYYNSANNYYSVRDDTTLPMYLRLNDLQQFQRMQEQQQVGGLGFFGSANKNNNNTFSSFERKISPETVTGNDNINVTEEQLVDKDVNVEVKTQTEDNQEEEPLRSSDSTSSSITEDAVPIRPRKRQQPYRPNTVYDNLTFTDCDILKFDPNLYHINIITDYNSYFEDFVCTNYLPESLALIPSNHPNATGLLPALIPTEDDLDDDKNTAEINISPDSNTSPINIHKFLGKSILYPITSTTLNCDPHYHIYKGMYQQRLLRLLQRFTFTFPHLRRTLTPQSHPVEVLKHLSAPVHTINLSKKEKVRPSIPSAYQSLLPTDLETNYDSPNDATQNIPNNNTQPDTNNANSSFILPAIFTYDTSKYLYPPAPVKPHLITAFIYNLLPSFNWSRVPQVSHQIDCVETYCARPRVDWSHFWRSRIIYFYPFNPGYDEDLMVFRHRLILVFSIVIFNLCLFISFSGHLERVINNLLSIVSSVPVAQTEMDWFSFFITANFAQSFVIVMSSPFLAFAMFDCERFKRSYDLKVRVMGWIIYLLFVVVGLGLFGGALFAFGLVLYTHRCDMIIGSILTFFFSSHLFSISCTWGIPLPILYVLLQLYGAVPRDVVLPPSEVKTCMEPTQKDPKHNFKPCINPHDVQLGTDIHYIKRMFIQGGVSMADYNGELIYRQAKN